MRHAILVAVVALLAAVPRPALGCILAVQSGWCATLFAVDKGYAKGVYFAEIAGENERCLFWSIAGSPEVIEATLEQGESLFGFSCRANNMPGEVENKAYSFYRAWESTAVYFYPYCAVVSLIVAAAIYRWRQRRSSIRCSASDRINTATQNS